MPEQFESGREFDDKKSLQDFDAKEMYLHPKNRSLFGIVSKFSQHILKSRKFSLMNRSHC